MNEDIKKIKAEIFDTLVLLENKNKEMTELNQKKQDLLVKLNNLKKASEIEVVAKK